MLQIIGLMGASYIFARMFIAFIREYPNEPKLTAIVIRLLSLLTALFALLCGFLLLVQGTDIDPTKLLRR